MGIIKLNKKLICYMDILGYNYLIDYYGEVEFLKIIDDAYKIDAHPDYWDSAFLHLCCFCQLLQIEFILSYKILLRGGITEGAIYINENYVYGKGLIKAYNLENNIAVFPRIIIDSTLESKTIILTLHGEVEVLTNDMDGYYFIDYLGKPSTNYDNHPIIARHKELVEANLANERLPEKIKQKYRWCKEYHNKICKKHGFDFFIQ